MKKILELDPNIFIPIGLIFMGIGGIWMGDAEEKNFIQLVVKILAGMDKNVIGMLIQKWDHTTQFDDFRAGADDRDNFHDSTLFSRKRSLGGNGFSFVSKLPNHFIPRWRLKARGLRVPGEIQRLVADMSLISLDIHIDVKMLPQQMQQVIFGDGLRGHLIKSCHFREIFNVC